MINKLKSLTLPEYDLILLPGFVQWDTSDIESQFSIKIKKGPEFASELPMILKDLDNIQLSNKIPANRLLQSSGENLYDQFVKEKLELAKRDLGKHTFYLNEEKSDIIIGRNLPPPIIAEIVNCTEKSNKNIMKKAQHYINSGADIIDLGCVSNKPNPERVKEIINVIRDNFDVLISIDSMDTSEILSAVDENIDLILSLDLGNYKDLSNIPKSIPIVILPTNIKEGYFPSNPKERVKNLFQLTEELHNIGFNKLIADPLLETPIAPGIIKSLKTYFLYRKRIKLEKYKEFELPMFFGISNVVELMDVDSVGINGLLASIAIELDMGILFTVEHSTKLMGGVVELKESVKLNFVAKHKKTPPINQGIQVFRAKGKINQEIPKIKDQEMILVNKLNLHYVPDENGYFKIYLNHYSKKIYIQHFSNDHKLQNTLIGTSAEILSKRIIELNLTNNLFHISYLGRELKKAELCLFLGKPYIQDE